jgi:thioredoxin-like negative regulator of GroEL
MAPQFAAAAAHLPDVRLVKVDAEASPGAGLQYCVRSIPTLTLFRGGKEITWRSGAMAAGDIARWVNGQLGRGRAPNIDCSAPIHHDRERRRPARVSAPSGPAQSCAQGSAA